MEPTGLSLCWCGRWTVDRRTDHALKTVRVPVEAVDLGNGVKNPLWSLPHNLAWRLLQPGPGCAVPRGPPPVARYTPRLDRAPAVHSARASRLPGAEGRTRENLGWYLTPQAAAPNPGAVALARLSLVARRSNMPNSQERVLRYEGERQRRGALPPRSSLIIALAGPSADLGRAMQD